MSVDIPEIIRTHGREREIHCDAAWWSRSLADHGYPSAVPDDLVEVITLNNSRITRNMVFEYQRGDPTYLLVASMMWGFGPVGYGPYRTAQMLTPRDKKQPVPDIVEEIRSAAQVSPQDGFGSLFASGRARIRQLGIAMGTKLLYFAAGRREGHRTPLVLDRVVFTACERIDITAPDPGKYTRSSAYSTFCADMAREAESLGVAPDVLEMSLFNWQQSR